GQIISYIRDPGKFKVNEYTQLVESPTVVGIYFRIDRDAPVRITADARYEWADGAEAPMTPYNQAAFDTQSFKCERKAYPFMIGNLALEQAKDVWKPLEFHT